MVEQKKKYRFLFIQPFQLPTGGKFADKYHTPELSKEKRLRMEYLNIRRRKIRGGTLHVLTLQGSSAGT